MLHICLLVVAIYIYQFIRGIVKHVFERQYGVGISCQNHEYSPQDIADFWPIMLLYVGVRWILRRTVVYPYNISQRLSWSWFLHWSLLKYRWSNRPIIGVINGKIVL